MRPEFRRSASPSPESNSAKAKAVLESRRVRSSFSFDPMAVSPLFLDMTFAIDIDIEEDDFVEELSKMITRLGGTIVRIQKMEPKTVLIWKRGDIANVEKADELKCHTIGQKWIFDCIEKNECLPLERYLISKADRDDGYLRKELNIKRLGKTKRSSFGINIKKKTKIKSEAEDNKEKARASVRFEKALKNKDMDEVLKGMANTLKDLYEYDPDIKNVLGNEDEPVNEDNFVAPKESPVRESTSKHKKIKRIDPQPSLKKPPVLIPASSFLRCLQNEKVKMIMYQGDFTKLHGLVTLKTEDRAAVGFLKVEFIYSVKPPAELVIVLDTAANSLGLIYAIFNNIAIVGQDYVEDCVAARKLLSPSSRPQFIINSQFQFPKKDLFLRTTFKVYEPETLKEMKLKAWTAKKAIEELGGRLSETLSLVDIVVVLTDEEGRSPIPKNLEIFNTYLINIVNEKWLVDSILIGTRLPYKDVKYTIPTIAKESSSKHERKPITKTLKDYYGIG
jgi:hypothetical protein